MKRIQYIFICAIGLLCLSGCVSITKYKEIENENRVLKSRLAEANKKIEGYENAPEKLFAEAKAIFNSDLNNANYQKLNTVYKKLFTYHPESKECSELKKVLDKWEKEIQRKALAEQEERERAIKKLKKSHDDVSGVTWYYNPYFTHYTNSNHASIYMGRNSGGKPWLRLKMSYYGDNWIFFEEAYLSYDGRTMQIPFDRYSDKKTEVGGGDVWEWIDVGVDDSILAFLKNMIYGKSVKMRLSGKYAKTRTLTQSEINGIRDVILAYESLL